jgi:hypothetical protein
METVINDSGFNINDIVKCRNYGCLYESYSEAMEALWGKKWHGFARSEEQYPNGLMGRNDFENRYYAGGYLWVANGDIPPEKYWEKKKWRIAGMIMHESGHTIMCQLIDELKRSILVGVDGLAIVKHNPKNNTPRVPKLPRRW